MKVLLGIRTKTGSHHYWVGDQPNLYIYIGPRGGGYHIYIYTQYFYLEPKWPLFLFEKAFFWEGSSPKREAKQVSGRYMCTFCKDQLPWYMPTAPPRPVFCFYQPCSTIRRGAKSFAKAEKVQRYPGGLGEAIWNIWQKSSDIPRGSWEWYNYLHGWLMFMVN